jgi:iron(III) transport system substrate-binding protein
VEQLMKHLFRMLALVTTLAMIATACTSGDNVDGDLDAADDQPATEPQVDDTLTVYGRRASDLFQLFEQETGIKILARTGQLDDLAEQIIADGTGSPADVYYAPLPDALGLLSAADRLAPLSDEQLGRVPEAYRSPDGTWVGTSGRALVVVYNTDRLSVDELPDSILGFTDPTWRGRIGWDPNNRALQGGITALRQLQGEPATRAWLDGIQANAPAVFSGPRAITTAVSAGEIIDVAFGNSWYLYDLQAEGDAMNVAAKFYPGNPGGVVGLAGVGIIDSTDNQLAAAAFVDFLLSPTAQRYFAEVSLEIPFVEGVAPPNGAPTAAELAVPGLDLRQQEDLSSTRELLREVGITG